MCRSYSRWSAQSRALQPFPARVLRRAAAADRDCTCARRQPEAHRRRRAGVGARRLGSGADTQSAQGPAGGVRVDVCLHRPRPPRRPPYLRSRRRDVPRQGRELADADDLYDEPASTRTRVRCSPRRRSRTRISGANAAPSSSRATCRTRSTRRAAAGSTRVARGHRMCARRSTRRSIAWPRASGRLPVPARALAVDRHGNAGREPGDACTRSCSDAVGPSLTRRPSRRDRPRAQAARSHRHCS